MVCRYGAREGCSSENSPPRDRSSSEGHPMYVSIHPSIASKIHPSICFAPVLKFDFEVREIDTGAQQTEIR